ncbi:methyltransferase family protein [Yoonia sp. 208BN28-4]|uniref:methyltransferase family protein n=1 Tax=Yoonia sp. 208BN28-4 TaxID=3126505 RepID=UPI0030AAC146
MKWIDLPPVWLAAMAMLVWVFAGQGSLMFAAQSTVGGVLIGAGLGLMASAIIEMTRRRTTVIPHMQAATLVDTGIFRFSRNPIYLGDTLILCGLILRWMPPWWLWLTVPAFVWIITVRFIKPEEAMLQTHFGTAFERYRKHTRRWL